MGSFDQAPANAQPFSGSTLTDPFDELLVQSVAVLKKTTYTPGAGDGYGQPDQSFQVILASWPARVSTNKSGSEYKQGKESAKNTFTVFMRPPTALVDDHGDPTELNTHHWLRFTDLQSNVHTLNITAVNDPSFIGHHYECKCEEYLP